MQAYDDPDGGADQAVEAEHDGEGGRGALPEHRWRAALAHPYSAGHRVCGRICEPVHGRSAGGPQDGGQGAATLHPGVGDQALVFPKGGGSGGGELELTTFSDVDMAGDVDGRRSTSGVLVFLGAAPVAWQSLKQKTVALSTCEAEYVAAAIAACQLVWMRRLLGELTGIESRPPVLKVDNQPAIALAKNPVLHDRSKHIDVKFHFLSDCVEEGQIVIKFVETGRQLADIFTKSVGRLRFLELRSKIGMVEVKTGQQD